MRAVAEGAVTGDGTVPKRTPLVLLWAFATLIWSIFTPPHKTFPARILIFQPLWAARIYAQDSTWVQDLLLFLITHAAYTYSTGAWRFLHASDLKWLSIHNPLLRPYIEILGLLSVCGALAGGITFRGRQLKSTDETEYLNARRIDEQLLPPLLITSRTMHSRLFPERHGFSYSYLFVGIPVGMRGAIGNALSVDTPKHSWFHVSSADFLARGGAHLGLAQKLKRYLHTQGVTDRDYSFVYLVTAPRFLGYSFNPVSFWYLYDSETMLKYMILEVNNTFDERRMYLLRADKAKSESITDLNHHSNGNIEEPSRQLVFTETWEKDFHVSPFNSRKGTYSLRATDPLAAFEESGQVRIDNTIVLSSSKDHAKVVARVWSENKPKEPQHVTRLELFRFIAAWWWVGLATGPRIVWEAQKLFFRKKLHVWFRPEVTEYSIGRTYTNDERQLEGFFSAFLEHAVEHSKEALRVIYEPAHADDEQIVFYSSGFTYGEDHQKTLSIQALSPAFYSRFVHYGHAREAFDRECLATDEKNKTVTITNSNLLPLLLDALQTTSSSKFHMNSYLEQVRWSWLRRLRCPPPKASYPQKETCDPEDNVTDIRRFRESELDRFVKNNCKDASVYRRIVTKIFLAQRLAFGMPILLSFLDRCLRVVLVLATLYFSDRAEEVDILRLRERGSKQLLLGDLGTLATLLLLANSVHFWSFLKG